MTTALWLALFAACVLGAVLAIALMMRGLRRWIDRRPADELHIFDHPVPSEGPKHSMDQGCWCLPEVQLRDGTAYVVHQVKEERDAASQE